MEKIVLKNGTRVIYKNINSELITINVSVEIGSIHENKNNNGISHFIEHMLFEGTKNRTAEEISSQIEKFGGELNAYTSNEKTNFYVKIHRKHAQKAVEILSDIISNPNFKDKLIKKEKNVILEEINMFFDEPKNYQWFLFQKNLYKNSYGFEIYGSKKNVSSFKLEQLRSFHKKYYIPNNIIITIVGKCNNYKDIVNKYFNFKNKNNIKKNQPVCKPFKETRIIKEKRKNLTVNYLIIGYNTFKRLKRESYVLDIIQAILSRGQSGKLFVEARIKRGLAYNIGVCNNCGPNYGFFAFYTSAKKENIKKLENIFFTELKNLENISINEINDAKSFIEGQIALQNEDSQEHADSISLFEECGQLDKFNEYIKTIKSIKKHEIIDISKKIIKCNYTKVLLH